MSTSSRLGVGQDIRHRWEGKLTREDNSPPIVESCHLWYNTGIQTHIIPWKFRAVLLNLSVNAIKSFLLLASCPQINYQEEETAQLKPRMPASSQYSLLRRYRHNSRVSLHSHRLECFRITPSLSRQQWIWLLTTICLTESTAVHMARHLIQYFSILIRNRKRPWRLQGKKKSCRCHTSRQSRGTRISGEASDVLVLGPGCFLFVNDYDVQHCL